MWIGSLISLIVWGIIWGVATNKVIENKGYSENWFWWGFFFGFLALIVACTKPQAQSYNSSSSSLFAAAAEEKMKIQQQSLLEQGGWKCNKCGNVNPSYSGTCNCGNLKASNQTKEIEDKRETANFQKMKSYKDLLDSGVITQEEFDAKKEQLLGLSEIKKIAEADEPLLKRAFMFLEDGNWSEADSYCEKVLDQDPENAQAYVGKLMAELHVRQFEDFLNCDQLFNNSNNYQKAVRFGGEKLAGILSGYIDFFIERNEIMRLTDVYNNAVTAMNAAKTESAFKAVAKTFKTISGFQDANTLAEQCLERAEDCRKDAIYTSARLQMTGNAVSGYESAIKKFSTISGWKDADEQIYACQKKIEELKTKEEENRLERERQVEAAAKKRKKIIAIVSSIVIVSIVFIFVLTKVIIPNSKYNSAIALYDAGNYDEAITAFKALNGYKDSAAQIEKCETAIKDQQYNSAVALYDAGKYEEAITAFTAIKGYKDSDDKTNECLFLKQNKGMRNATIGSTIKFGSYEQDNNTSNGKEEIEWIVLAVIGDKALIISKYSLDQQPYDSTDTYTTWDKCSLRTWLNRSFYNDAFGADHQEIIISSQISVDDTTDYSNTTDKVFLLSVREAKNYFSSNSARNCERTLYCGGWGKDSAWWLRSTGTESRDADYVLGKRRAAYVVDGEIRDYGMGVGMSLDVRPALWINLGS